MSGAGADSARRVVVRSKPQQGRRSGPNQLVGRALAGNRFSASAWLFRDRDRLNAPVCYRLNRFNTSVGYKGWNRLNSSVGGQVDSSAKESDRNRLNSSVCCAVRDPIQHVEWLSGWELTQHVDWLPAGVPAKNNHRSGPRARLYTPCWPILCPESRLGRYDGIRSGV